jgi:ABC-type bacteriocin/lantibiotic exporter with double-glycine peptidase domain
MVSYHNPMLLHTTQRYSGPQNIKPDSTHTFLLVIILIFIGYVPWRETLLYVFYRWIAGSCIGGLRRQFWMPIALFSYRSLTTAAYNHAMLLSYDFHSGKSSSDINTDISRGNSVNGFVDTIAFQIAPMLSDLCIAFGYFFFLFDSYMALVVAVVSVMYIYISIKQTAAQIDIRKATVDVSVTLHMSQLKLTYHRPTVISHA